MSQNLQLVVRIRADGTAEVVGATRQVAAGVGGIDDASRRAGAGARTLSAELGQMRNTLVGLGAVAAGFKVVQWADDWTRAAGRLALVSKGTAELAANQQKLFGLAQDTRSAFDTTVDLYARMSRSSRELGLSQSDVLRLTEAVNKAVKISGGNAASAAAGLFQFNQALASGQLRGEELNSVLEQTPRLAEAIAAGLGVPVGKLRELAEAGELTGRKVVAAVGSQIGALNEEFAKLPVTVEDAFQKMENSAKRWIGQTDSAFGGTRALAGGIGLLADNFGTVADLALTAAGVIGTVYAGRAVSVGIASTRQFIAAQTAAGVTINTATGAVIRQTTAMTAGAIAARAFGSTLAFLGGPVGAAVAALTLGLGYLATRQSEAEAAAVTHAAAMEDFNRVFDTSTGKIRDQNSELARNIALKAQNDLATQQHAFASAREMASTVGGGTITARALDATGFFSTRAQRDALPGVQEARDAISRFEAGATSALTFENRMLALAASSAVVAASLKNENFTDYIAQARAAEDAIAKAEAALAVLTGTATEAHMAILGLGSGVKKVDDGLVGAVADFDKLKSKLEETLGTLGLTEAQALRWRLEHEAMAKEGVKSADQLTAATRTQIAEAVRLQQAIDGRKASIRAAEDAEEDWAGVIASVAKLERDQTKKVSESEQAIKDQVAAIEDEARQIGLSAEEREYAVETMRAEAVARKANRDLSAEEVADLRRATAARIEARKADAAREEASRERQRAAEEDLRRWERMVDQAADYGAGRIADQFFSRTRAGWKDLLTGMGEDFARALMHMAAQAALRPVLVTVGQTLGLGSSASGAGAGGMGGMGGLGSLGNLGSLFSGGGGGGLYGIGQGIATSGVGRALGMSTYVANAEPVALAGANVATGFGNLFAEGLAASPWGIVGGLGANLMGLGTRNPLGGTLGGMAGSIGGGMAGASMLTMLGSAAGPVGAVVGAFLGTALGGSIGAKPSNNSAGGGINLETGKLFGLASKGDENVAARDSLLGTIGTTAQLLKQAAGATGFGSPTVGVDVGSRDGTQYVVGGRPYRAADPKSALDQIVKYLATDLEGIGDQLAAVIGKIDFSDTTKAITDIEFARQLIDFTTSMDDLGFGLAQVADQARAAAEELKAQALADRDRAKALGLSAEYLATTEAKLRMQMEGAQYTAVEAALTNVNTQFAVLAETVAALGLGITAAEIDESRIKAIKELFGTFDDAQLDEAAAMLGGDLGALALAMKGAARSVESLRQAGAGIVDWLDDLRAGGAGLTAEARLQESQALFQRDLELARGNNEAALARITGAAGNLLDATSGMYGHTAQYQAMQAWIADSLEGLAATQAARTAVPAYASGTDFHPGGVAYVHQDELLHLPRGTQVFSRQETMRLTAGGDAGLREEVRGLRGQMRDLTEELRGLVRLNAAAGDGNLQGLGAVVGGIARLERELRQAGVRR